MGLTLSMRTLTVFNIFILFILINVCSNYHVTANHNNSELDSVFWDAIGATTLADLLGGKAVNINSTLHSSCLDSDDKYSSLRTCLKSQCINADELAKLYSLPLDSPLNQTTITYVAPGVLYIINQKSTCQENNSNSIKPNARPSPSAVWGYSFLFVTVINLCSVTGILFLPCMKSSVYKVILMFMVSLAVGTLLSSGVLVLIPEAFGLTHVATASSNNNHGDETSHKYIWTATSVIGGVYMFFIMERIMRLVNTLRENTKEKRHRDKIATRGTMTSSFTRRTPHNASLRLKDPSSIHLERRDFTDCLCMVDASETRATPERSIMEYSEGASEDVSEEADEEIMVAGEGVGRDETQLKKEGKLKCCTELLGQKIQEINGHDHHGHSHDIPRRDSHQHVAPVAYMVIFGDSLHNFIDGLSIGAAFTDSVLLGISVSVAVMCEELPHELGDFAILLNSGMRVRRALLFNFMSSLMCYAGVVLGIFVGENTTAHTWIFGLAGGMFLYISLVDMIPEMNSAAESKDAQQFGLMKTFLLQNVGFLLGYTIILMMALFGGEITFE